MEHPELEPERIFTSFVKWGRRQSHLHSGRTIATAGVPIASVDVLAVAFVPRSPSSRRMP